MSRTSTLGWSVCWCVVRAEHLVGDLAELRVLAAPDSTGVGRGLRERLRLLRRLRQGLVAAGAAGPRRSWPHVAQRAGAARPGPTGIMTGGAARGPRRTCGFVRSPAYAPSGTCGAANHGLVVRAGARSCGHASAAGSAAVGVLLRAVAAGSRRRLGVLRLRGVGNSAWGVAVSTAAGAGAGGSRTGSMPAAARPGGAGLGQRDAVAGQPQRHQGLDRGLAAPGAAEAGLQPGLVDEPVLFQPDDLLVGAQLPQLHPAPQPERGDGGRAASG